MLIAVMPIANVSIVGVSANCDIKLAFYFFIYKNYNVISGMPAAGILAADILVVKIFWLNN